MADIVFTITSRNGNKALGTLSWAAKELTASVVSGDSNHAATNVGTWTARRSLLLDKPAGSIFCDGITSGSSIGHCWFQAFDDQFGRTEIGIHPDGGVPNATAGCIGLKQADTKAWYDAFFAIPAGGTLSVEVKEALV